MTSYILFSIIVPVYNNSQGIRTVLRSLVNQDFKKGAYEIIVVDNGSNDDTAAAVRKTCQEHPDLVNYLSENENRGSYAARNKGIRHARGEILAFTDSDCTASADWLIKGLEHMDRFNASCIGGNILFTYVNKDKPNIFEIIDSTTNLNQEKYVNCYRFAATANLFVKKVVFEKYGPFRPDMVSGGDVEFGMRISGQGEKIKYARDAVVYHPARSTFYELFEKVKRVSMGKRRFVDLGLRKKNSVKLSDVAPRLSYPAKTAAYKRLSRVDKFKLLALHNIFRWIGSYYEHSHF